MNKEVVRVACANNFNCTPAEYSQLDEIARQNPNQAYFTNSNVRTPKLLAISDHPYKAVITANPDLTVNQDLVERLYAIDSSKIGFIRVKWLPGKPEIVGLIDELLEERYPVVLTLQRFNSKAKLLQYTDLEHYQHSCSRFRLHGKAFKEVCQYVDRKYRKGMRAYICDRKGLGCQGCGLCAQLTQGVKKHTLLSLNLSTSGICKFNCVDCYAKTLQHFLIKCGNRPLEYDVIKKNRKQCGNTKHILKAKANLK